MYKFNDHFMYKMTAMAATRCSTSNPLAACDLWAYSDRLLVFTGGPRGHDPFNEGRLHKQSAVAGGLLLLF